MKTKTNTLNICLAQIEVVPRQPVLNKTKILDAISKAGVAKSDLIVFPEMCIPGYIIGDNWERNSFLNDCECVLDEIILSSKNYSDLTIVLGTIDVDRNKKNEDGRYRKYNSTVVIQDGSILLKTVKTLQPNYREFDDNRHFYDNRKLSNDRGEVVPDFRRSIFEKIVNGQLYKIGCLTCEDSWDVDYSVHPVDELAALGVDIIINISCSPYTLGKNSKRNRLFSAHAKKIQKPIVYVNNVGVQNNTKNVFTFDGNSCIYDMAGNQYNPGQPFRDFVITKEINIASEFGDMLDTCEGTETLWNALVYGTSVFCRRLGISKVVIGASGGIDSALSAVLFVKSLGKENVTLVNMPSRYNSELTKDAAQSLAAKLDCKYVVIPIEPSVILTNKQMGDAGFELTEFMLQNVQARDRSSRILAAVSASVGGVFSCNANKSEAMVGYTTLYGDLAGFFAPLADIWKTQIYELAVYVNNKYGELIPCDTINVIPSAELSESQDVTKGKGDPIIYSYHDKLFSSWIEKWERATTEECLEWYLDGTIAEKIGYDETLFPPIKTLFKDAKSFIADIEKWWNLYDGFAIAKRIQSTPVLSVSRRSIGFDHRETQEPPYYSAKYIKRREEILRTDLRESIIKP